MRFKLSFIIFGKSMEEGLEGQNLQLNNVASSSKFGKIKNRSGLFIMFISLGMMRRKLYLCYKFENPVVVRKEM